MTTLSLRVISASVRARPVNYSLKPAEEKTKYTECRAKGGETPEKAKIPLTTGLLIKENSPLAIRLFYDVRARK